MNDRDEDRGETAADEGAIREILEFWFGAADDPDRHSARERWFAKDPAFDAECGRRFAALVERALGGDFAAWEATPTGAVALEILLDQLPRNLFRGSPRAFAGDARAREVARRALAQGFDGRLAPVERWFLYIPFEHSESLADQERAVELFRTIEPDPEKEPLRSVLAHHRIIARFGRFPHRNVALGRESTAEEIAFLDEPDSSF